MAVLEQRETPFGTKPSQLDAPVPGAQEQQDFAQEVAAAPVPEAAQQAASAEEVDPLAAFGTSAASSEVDPLAEFGAPAEEVPQGEAPAELSFIEQAKEGVKQSLARAKVSFGVTEDEKLRAAQSIFPSAVLDGGEIFRKSKKTGEMIPLDPEHLEIIDDTLDFSRDIVEGIIETAFVAGGAAAGGAAGTAEGAAVGSLAGPVGAAAGGVTAGGLGAIAGATAAGAVGAATASAAGDFIQEKLLGIERDPERRSKGQEALVNAAFGGVFSIFGAALAKRKLGKEADKLRQQNLIKATELDAVDEVELAKDAIKTVQDAGLAKTINGDILLSPNQLNPSNPDARAAAKEIANRPEFRDFLAKQGEVLDDAYQTVAASIGNAGSSKVGVGKRFIDSIRDINQVEGKLIGKFREDALKSSKGVPVQTQNFNKFLNDTVEQLGIDPTKPIDPDLILDSFPDLTETQAKTLGKKFSALTDLVQKNPAGLSLKQVDTEYKKLTNSINLLSKGSAGKPLAYKLINMKNALRDDWTQAIGQELGPASQEAYQTALGKFSKIKGATNELNALLKNENISKEALSKKLFGGGTSLANIRNVKTVVQEGDPDLWKDLVFDHISGLKNKHTNPDTLSVNWSALGKEVDKLGVAGKKEIFDGSDFTPEQFGAVIKLGRLTNLGEVELRESMNNASNLRRLKNSFMALAPTFIGTRLTNLSELASSFGKDKALAKFLSAGGLEEILKGVPKKKASRLRNIVQPMVDKIAAGARATGKAVGRTEPRIITREAENE